MTDQEVKTIAEFLLQQTHDEFTITRKVLAAVPAENTSYKPSGKCMCSLDLAGHIPASEAFFLRGVINGAFEWKQPDFKTPADALAFYEETIPALIEQARAIPAAKLATPISFGPFSQPAYMYLALNLKHSIHHRGQLSAYIRPMGGKVPGIYGPSADDKVEAASS